VGTLKGWYLLASMFLTGLLPASDLTQGHLFPDLRTGLPVHVGPVTAETIEGFELLYANPGTGDIAEIAGHLLLRIRIRRETADPDRDLVVSFLAATPEAVLTVPDAGQAPLCRTRNWWNLIQPPGVDTSESPLESLLQSWKGLTGRYPVTMDLQTLGYIRKTYTMEQDRTLRRYELLLTPEEQEGILNRLLRYQTEAPPRYYFFHQNCGSVLVRMLGEGMKHDRISSFSPVVSPPHSLVGLLIREGKARPVEPDLHSFREQGRLYRLPLLEQLERMTLQNPDLDWPAARSVSHPKTSTRIQVVEQLRILGASRLDLDTVLYPFAGMMQETETVFDPKDRFCRDATGPVTAELRRWQQEMLLRSGENIAVPLPPVPHGPVRTGTDHTGLFPLEMKALWLEPEDQSREVGGAFSTRALRQEMGSRSRVAMQRAGAVDLFALEAQFTGNGMHKVKWGGLDLKKFREGLGKVEAGPWRARAWGVGLRVLKGEWKQANGDWKGTVAGVSGLLNLLSSDQYHHHLFVEAGIDAGHRNSNWGVRIPLAVQGLVTLGDSQWRLRAGWTESGITSEQEEWEVKLRLNHRIGRWRGADWNGLLEWEWSEELGDREQALWMGVEILRF